MEKFSDRFKFHFSRTNPLLFLSSRERIEEAQRELKEYYQNLEKSKEAGVAMRMLDHQRDRMIENSNIVGTSVHPDTEEIIPFYMRLSGFVPFNLPLVFAVLFIRN